MRLPIVAEPLSSTEDMLENKAIAIDIPWRQATCVATLSWLRAVFFCAMGAYLTRLFLVRACSVAIWTLAFCNFVDSWTSARVPNTRAA